MAFERRTALLSKTVPSEVIVILVRKEPTCIKCNETTYSLCNRQLEHIVKSAGRKYEPLRHIECYWC